MFAYPICPIPFGIHDRYDVLNWVLFSGRQLAWGERAPVGDFIVQRSTSPLNIDGRELCSVKIRNSNGTQFIHPFYCSTGTATPELSPKGTWWPMSGIWPAEISPLGCDWIGKHFWSTEDRQWVDHDKETAKLPAYLKAICDWLARVETKA